MTFIKKPFKRDDLLAAYARTHNLKAACTEVGCPPYTAYIILQCAGLLKGTDRQQYGGAAQIAGRQAEDEFQRLVPQAMDMNIDYSKNHPGYDFNLNGLKIDVKFSTLTKQNGENKTWLFDVERNRTKSRKIIKDKPDFFVLFATEGKKLKDGYKLFLFPWFLVAEQKSIRFQPGIPSRWHDFEIEPSVLADTLADAAAVLSRR